MGYWFLPSFYAVGSSDDGEALASFGGEEITIGSQGTDCEIYLRVIVVYVCQTTGSQL